ncbi:CoA pyrophosphatase [Sphingomicrobium sediminis]|uniref:CoA pyrophosphatase n=1 Tax=Sphingomicrobium sediminis TaxID=2950949 RepID=A0A9X2J1X8_9SPHN|nr:CoA pyrophosphatase [Sphingomicrobium sediminis]MCM8556450.1 CoA pyrophosphatase [Sphingomicrobium sediminis]
MPLYDRLRAALDRPTGRALLHGDLDPDETPDATPAAVLVPITYRHVDTVPGPGFILTKRNANMRNHAGQVSFPGGRIDSGETAVEAALREAEEEIALPRDKVKLVGAMDPYVTGTGFHVLPVIGLVEPDLPLVANEAEVDHWFEVPMGHLLDPKHHREEEVLYKGRQRRYWRIDYQDYDIWGATAAMIVNLSRRLNT